MDLELDLQNELFELSELCPGDEDIDSEEEMQKDLEKLKAVPSDNFLEEEDEYELGGVRIELELNDPLLQLLKDDYGNTIFYNTREENEVILQCQDKELQSLLVKNRIRAKQLRMLYSKLSTILKNCTENAIVNWNSCKRPQLSMPKTDIWKLGIPYFKDKQFYPSPENSDAIQKRLNKEFSFINFKRGRPWRSEDQALLRCTIEQVYYRDYCKDLQRKIDISKFKCDNDKDVAINEEVLDYKKQLTKLESSEDKYKMPPFLCDSIDWYAVVEAFKGTRTVNECKALWNIYLHPKINKGLWKRPENDKIKQLVKKHRFQNWDAIAKELDTGRSGYLVFLNYYTNLWSKFRMDRFTKQEDAKILQLVDKYRVGCLIPWRIVSNHFTDRSKAQIYHRYKYYLVPAIRKGPFSEAEDVFLLYLVSKHGTDFQKCAKFFPNRTCIQIRNRYKTSLCNSIDINRGNFTVVEDEIIMEHVKKHGLKEWKSLAAELNRNSSHVRQHYAHLERWLKNPGCTLENMTRRQHDLLYRHNCQREFRIRTVVERLNNYRKVDLALIVELLEKIALPFSVKDVPGPKTTFYDRKIIEFLKGTCKIQRQHSMFTDADVTNSINRINKLLPLLSAPPNIFENVNVDRVTERDHHVLSKIICQKPNSHPQLPLKFIMPPTLNTILGLRGLLVKYQIYKESKVIVLNKPGNPQLAHEHVLFLMRMYVLLKWPCILSQFFADQLHVDEPKVASAPHKPKKSVGRPRKLPKTSRDVTVVLPRNPNRPVPNKSKEKVNVLAYKRMKLDECVEGTSSRTTMKLRNRKLNCRDDDDDGDDPDLVEVLSDDSNLGDSNVTPKVGLANESMVIVNQDGVEKCQASN